MDYCGYFKGKEITVMGLGLLGRSVNVARFLAECGAELIVTDLKTKEELTTSVEALKGYDDIEFVFGEHRLEDFRDRDMVIKAAGVPLDSPYVAEAQGYDIPVEMDASLFVKLLPDGVTTIGVTGTRGKSTTTHLLYEILDRDSRQQTPDNRKIDVKSLAFDKVVFDKESKARGQRPEVFLGGNIRGLATLSLLKEVKAGDVVVLELDSWQLQGFGDSKISPNIAVFTTFYDDHMNYYRGDRRQYFADKANIFLYQNKDDTLVVGKQAESFFEKFGYEPKGKMTVVSGNGVPREWNIQIPGDHNRGNIACAVAAAKAAGVGEGTIKKVVENFEGIPGRLEFLREVNLPVLQGAPPARAGRAGGRRADSVKVYNDNNATTPEATIAALRALSDTPIETSFQSRLKTGFNQHSGRRVVLIMGGSDKGLDMTSLLAEIEVRVKAVVLLPGSGTERIAKDLHNLKDVKIFADEPDFSAIVNRAASIAEPGDVVLLSPAFASFSRLFNNEYERNDQFVALVEKLGQQSRSS